MVSAIYIGFIACKHGFKNWDPLLVNRPNLQLCLLSSNWPTVKTLVGEELGNSGNRICGRNRWPRHARHRFGYSMIFLYILTVSAFGPCRIPGIRVLDTLRIDTTPEFPAAPLFPWDPWLMIMEASCLCTVLHNSHWAGSRARVEQHPMRADRRAWHGTGEDGQLESLWPSSYFNRWSCLNREHKRISGASSRDLQLRKKVNLNLIE